VDWLWFILLSCVIWHWIGDLWNWWRVSYLWNRWRLGVVGCGIVIGLIIWRMLSLAIVWVSLWKERRVWWRILLVRGCLLHGMVHFSRWRLWHRIVAILLHLSFEFDEYWVIFYAVVDIAVVVHAVWRLECALATTSASTWYVTPLIVLVCFVVEGSLTPFLRGWSKILFSVFWRPIAIRIDVVNMLGVAMLPGVIVMRWPWGFTCLGAFICCLSMWKWRASNLLNLAKFS
jgi:hypothetical protein